MRLTRRQALSGGAAVLALGATSGGHAMADTKPLAGAAGFATDLGARLDEGVASGVLAGLHAVVVIRGGEVAAATYWPGRDESWGGDLGVVDHGPDTLHDLRSVTKSVVSLLYGIALAAGMVPGPDATLMDSFPGYPDLAADPARARWTVGDALNMQLGTAWNEDLPYSDPRNSEREMEAAPDRFRFILDRPVVGERGQGWIYNGGATALIGRIVEQGTGMKLSAYARKVLFDPLGVGRTEWIAGADGVEAAASGLRMTAPDLARIGQMMAAGGVWQGARIVPETWLKACRTAQAQTPFGLAYSNFWYLSEQPVPAAPKGRLPMIAANGNGGQRLFVFPEADLVVVTFSGGYNRPDQFFNPTLVLQRVVLANLKV